MTTYDYAFANLLKHEGGYVNDPVDPGGETKYGISKRAYPSEDIKNMTAEHAKSIYFRDYWLKNKLEGVHDKDIASAALDTVVNHGRGPWLLQEAAKASGSPIKPDGIIGPATIASINTIPVQVYLDALYNIRKGYYEDLVAKNPAKIKFLAGWLKRIDGLSSGTVTGGGAIFLALVGLLAFWLKKKLHVD